MQTIIVSDVHIGCRFFLREPFVRFLDGLPQDAALVLNGDTIDRWHRRISAEDEAVIARLRAESRRRQVIWVYGNHDDEYRMRDPAQIEFRTHYAIGRRLFVSHGFDFDNVMPYHRTFVRCFRFMHHVRVFLGAEAVHVAHYAKKWGFLYRVLLKNVTMNAVEYARENGYAAVACGHTHCVQDEQVDGIRYLNTGSWTERPLCYIRADDRNIELVRFESA